MIIVMMVIMAIEFDLFVKHVSFNMIHLFFSWTSCSINKIANPIIFWLFKEGFDFMF